MSKHLWEVEHEYHCDDAEHWQEYESFEEFQEEEGDSDMDYNLLVRWDWEEENEETGELNYNGDDYHRNGKLKLYFVSQRKGLLRSVDVEVCRADEKKSLNTWLLDGSIYTSPGNRCRHCQSSAKLHESP